jgi:NAD(P)H-flavin reductase
MSSPAEARFNPARLVSLLGVGGGLSQLRIDPGPRVAATYESPGQYVEVRAEGETGYFVLASEPGDSAWDLVMKSGGGASDVLLRMTAGGALEVTGPIGAGFPMAEVRGRPLVVVLGGVGVAAGRPLVRRRLRDGDAARTWVFVATRRRDESALEDDLEAWARAGVAVTVCLSQGTDADEGGRFVLGRVPDVLRAFAASHPGAITSAVVFSVGTASMAETLREVAPSLGIRAEDVLTNH